jgi:hypothetical protein
MPKIQKPFLTDRLVSVGLLLTFLVAKHVKCNVLCSVPTPVWCGAASRFLLLYHLLLASCQKRFTIYMNTSSTHKKK